LPARKNARASGLPEISGGQNAQALSLPEISGGQNAQASGSTLLIRDREGNDAEEAAKGRPDGLYGMNN
jgi:hypothetical protein